MYTLSDLNQIKKSHFLTKDGKYALLPEHSQYTIGKGYSIPKELSRRYFYWHPIELLEGTTYRVSSQLTGENASGFTMFSDLTDNDSRSQAINTLNSILNETY